MPQRKQRSVGGKNRKRGQSATNTALATLIDLEKTQLHGTVPSVRDVPMMKIKRDKVYTFTRDFAIGTITSPTVADLLGAYSFSLSSLPSPGDFTTLFDQYRFMQVTVSYIPLAGVGTGSPPLVTAIDIDDSTAPASMAELYQYDTVQFSQPGNVVIRTFSPYAATAVYSGTFTSFAELNRMDWVDVASPNVQYYGLKYGVAAASGATANWQVFAKITLQLRHPR